MIHQGTKTIETGRLRLRKFVAKDGEHIYKNWASDDNVTRYLTWPTHKDMETSMKIAELWEQESQSDTYYQWAIELKKKKQVIGSIAAVNMIEAIDTIEVGYCIGKKYWNEGYTTEALKAVIKFFFQEVQANRIEAGHDVHNSASGKVMSKCGMQFEGVQRKRGKNNTGICNMAMYAILRDDWDE